jgi:hypothetical protein
MKKLLFTIGVATVLTACSTVNYATHNVSETPTMTTRQASIYLTITLKSLLRTKMSIEQYNRIVAITVNNREERN